jgi:hypothetical protein
MSTESFESPRGEDIRAAPHAPSLAHGLVLPWFIALGSAVHRSLAAINWTWVGFANRRFNESLSLPEKLGGCESLSGAVRVYGAYCRTTLEQYEAAFAEFQQIGVSFAREAPAVGLVAVRITPSEQAYAARSRDPAARGSLS